MRCSDPGKYPYRYLFILLLVLALYTDLSLAKTGPIQQKNNKEADLKPIKLSATQLAAVAGKYQYLDSYVTITPANGGIILKQHQGQRAKISFYPTDLHEFRTRYFSKPYWIMFSGNVKGKAPSFLTADHDIWVRVK